MERFKPKNIRRGISDRYNHARHHLGIRVLAAMTVLTAPATAYGVYHEFQAAQHERIVAASTKNAQNNSDSYYYESPSQEAANDRNQAIAFLAIGGLVEMSAISGMEYLHRKMQAVDNSKRLRVFQLLGTPAIETSAREFTGTDAAFRDAAEEMVQTAHLLDERQRIQGINPGLGGIPDTFKAPEDPKPEDFL